MRLRILFAAGIITGWGMVPAVLFEYPGDVFRLVCAILLGLFFTCFYTFLWRSSKWPI